MLNYQTFDPLHKSNITYTEQSIFWYLNCMTEN